MHIKYVVIIMHSLNMTAIFVIFSIIITIPSEFDLETLYIIHICEVCGMSPHLEISENYVQFQSSYHFEKKVLYLLSLLEF